MLMPYQAVLRARDIRKPGCSRVAGDERL